MIDIIGMGMGEQDLTPAHWAMIKRADLLVGGRRHLEIFNGLEKETLVITGKIDHIVATIRNRMADEQIVVLASGDPLFFGIGSTLVNALGQENIAIHPNITSLGAAFSAIKKPWHDALLLSLHGREPQDLVSLFKDSSKIGILTDNTRTPGWIADFLIQNDLTHFTLCVLERIGTDHQTVSWHRDMGSVTKHSFATPNVVILMGSEFDCRGCSDKNDLPHARPSVEPPFESDARPAVWPGMPDRMFAHQKGLITKSEVRSISISKLCLGSQDHVVWDLGAGSGSVGIEASRFVPGGQVFAVEKNESRIADILANRQKFQAENLQVIQGNTLDMMAALPDPDRIFIGGGGRDLLGIIKGAGSRIKPGGVIVVNTVLIQNTAPVLDLLKKMGFTAELIQILVSRSKPMPVGERLEALNPVWIITGKHLQRQP